LPLAAQGGAASAESVAIVAGFERGEGLSVRLAASEGDPRVDTLGCFCCSVFAAEAISSPEGEEGLAVGADTLRLAEDGREWLLRLELTLSELPLRECAVPDTAGLRLESSTPSLSEWSNCGSCNTLEESRPCILRRRNPLASILGCCGMCISSMEEPGTVA